MPNWWDATWNPVGGCSVASPGCKNCYASRLAATQQVAHRIPLYRGTTNWVNGQPVFNGDLTVLPSGHDGWTRPLRWRGAKTLAILKGESGHLHVGRQPARFDASFRQRLELKQPSARALRWIANREDALINGTEVAVDFVFANWAERDDALEFLHRHLVRRWHGQHRIRVLSGAAATRYDARRTARNVLVLYRQTFSRITGELCVLHLEWRANGSRAVRATGISSGKDIVEYDHRTFWTKRLLLYDIDPARLGKYLRNRSRITKSRVATACDRRIGHVVCASVDTMQDLIDEYGAVFRIQRAMQRIPADALLPAPTLLCSIPDHTAHSTSIDHNLDPA
jgi:hypothetical protein